LLGLSPRKAFKNGRPNEVNKEEVEVAG